MTRNLGFTNDEASAAAVASFTDSVKLALGATINAVRAFAEDDSVDEPIVVAGLVAVRNLVGQRANLANLAVGRPVAALGTGASNSVDETAFEALRERIAQLESDVSEANDAKAEAERKLADTQAELDPNTHGSVAYELASEKADAERFKKDREILERIAQELGVPVPANSNTGFARDTAQKVKEAVQARVNAATPAAFDRAAVEADFASVSTALQAVKSGRATNKVEGLREVRDVLRNLREHLGLPPATPPASS